MSKGLCFNLVLNMFLCILIDFVRCSMVLVVQEYGRVNSLKASLEVRSIDYLKDRWSVRPALTSRGYLKKKKTKAKISELYFQLRRELRKASQHQ